MMEEDFLQKYADYAGELTDAPIEFHNFVGLVVLAVALGKNVFFQHTFKTYLNIWLILLAPSSIFRKTTCLTMGKRLLQKVCPTTILPNEFTTEKLADLLEKNPQGILFFSEFMSLLGAFKKDYHCTTKAFLTDIYDCPPFYTRQTMGREVKIEDPVLSMVTATTTEWFLTQAKQDDLYGGFLARFIYVPMRIKVKTMAFPNPRDTSVESRLGIILNEIRTTVKGEATFSPEARSYYEKWYRQFESRIGSNSMSGLQSRLTVYCLKFACLYEVSATRSLVVSIESMERACKITVWLSNQLMNLEREEFAFTLFSRNKKVVLRLIRTQPGITKSKLSQGSHLPKRDLDSVLDTLKEEESIVVKYESKDGKQRKSTCYYETDGGAS